MEHHDFTHERPGEIDQRKEVENGGHTGNGPEHPVISLHPLQFVFGVEERADVVGECIFNKPDPQQQLYEDIEYRDKKQR